MKNKVDILKISISVCLFLVLVGFTYNRHKQKAIKNIEISFSQNEAIFIDTAVVNKLLIQNQKHVKNVPSEDLDLNLLETRLEIHPMVENAEVYLSLDNNLHVDILQPKPIGRVIGEKQFYIDRNGEEMPLSDHFTARVPIVYSLKKDQISNAYNLLNYIDKDKFLKKMVTQVKCDANNQFSIKMRKHDFEIVLGNTKNLDQKFFNFKAFYVKAERDSLLQKYKTIKLQFGSQVVCEKY